MSLLSFNRVQRATSITNIRRSLTAGARACDDHVARESPSLTGGGGGIRFLTEDFKVRGLRTNQLICLHLAKE